MTVLISYQNIFFSFKYFHLGDKTKKTNTAPLEQRAYINHQKLPQWHTILWIIFFCAVFSICKKGLIQNIAKKISKVFHTTLKTKDKYPLLLTHHYFSFLYLYQMLLVQEGK